MRRNYRHWKSAGYGCRNRGVTMSNEKIAEAVEETIEDAGEQANEIMESAEEHAADVEQSSHESVNDAAQAVADASEQVQNMQKELEWKLSTKEQLDNLNQKMHQMSENLQTIPAALAAMQAQMLERLTPPPPPLPEKEAAPLESPPLQPEEVAEKQPPSRKRKATFL